MILVNFSHPLTPEGLEVLEKLVGGEKVEEITVACQFDLNKPLERQVTALVHETLAQIGYPANANLVIPPALSYAAALLPLIWAQITGVWAANLVVVSKASDSLPPKFLPSQVVPVIHLANANLFHS